MPPVLVYVAPALKYPTLRNIAERLALTKQPSALAAAIGGLNHWRALEWPVQLPCRFSTEGNPAFPRYLSEIRKFPMLEPQEEYMLAKRWREHDDRDAAHQLVTSHLRLVAKIAMGYRGYGLPISEVVSEGNVGLMQAVKRFEPERAFVSPPTPCGGSRRQFKSTSCVPGRS